MWSTTTPTRRARIPNSILDKLVPGYYHRLNGDGIVLGESCCADTATEHAMMEKLMVDSTVLWAKQYKVDGFRFDIMGFHLKSNMLKVRAALDALTLGEGRRRWQVRLRVRRRLELRRHGQQRPW